MRGRGRGRGGRGHGGRGGRGGRGRGSSRGRGGRGSRSQSQPREETTTTPRELNIETDVTSYFVGSVSADQHFEGQQQNRDRYAAAMAVLQKNGVDIAQNARIRALAAAWARHDYELADAFLQNKDNFGLLEVLKAVTLLDSGRQIRVLEKKMKRLQTSAGKVKPTKIGKLKSDIDNLNKTKPLHGTASGAICKHIRSWVKRFTKDELEFYALHFSKDPWKKLADICNFHPKQVLNLAVEMQAGGGTTPAASVWPFFEKKEVVKTFIIVKDEEENGQCHGDNFHDMYQKYHDEVYPAKLVFVSFFHNQNSRGDMVPKLEANGHKPMRFIFDFARPDLTKLDKMFGMLASGTTSFDDEIAEVMSEIKSGRLAKVFEKMEI